MNIYFLVEGNKTERKVYPAWLFHLLPELRQVKNYDLVEKNNYFLFSGQGYPSIIYTHLKNAIADIQANGKYNYLVICLDAEEQNVADVKQEIDSYLNTQRIDLGNVRLETIVQNRCLETWFLGNRRIYTRNPQNGPLLEYTRHYDVSANCPELMGKYPSFNTHAQFHGDYLDKLFKAKEINYSKTKPGDVLKPFYLQQLHQRIQEQDRHLPSFQEFIRFCDRLKRELSHQSG